MASTRRVLPHETTPAFGNTRHAGLKKSSRMTIPPGIKLEHASEMSLYAIFHRVPAVDGEHPHFAATRRSDVLRIELHRVGVRTTPLIERTGMALDILQKRLLVSGARSARILVLPLEQVPSDRSLATSVRRCNRTNNLP
jgi:hypothetical protein